MIQFRETLALYGPTQCKVVRYIAEAIPLTDTGDYAVTYTVRPERAVRLDTPEDVLSMYRALTVSGHDVCIIPVQDVGEVS